MKKIIMLFALISLNAHAYNLQDLKSDYSKAKSRGPAAVLGLKEGKVKKIGDQHFIQYKGEIYNMVSFDEEKLQQVAEQYQKMQKKK